MTFSTTALATIAPASGTALTDGAGVATVTLTGGATAGASTITASAQVGTAAVSGSVGYSVGVASVTITNPTFGVTTLSAFGTTGVAVTVSSGGVPVATPQTVTFTSPCATSGKAVLSASAVTVNGTATGSYRDNGCAGTDTVTASVSGIVSSSASLTVIAPSIGSIQFVSATPTSITLKGTGGAGRQESSKVAFKVVDTGGNPLSGKTVNFSLSTSVGGIAFATGGVTATAISGSDGQVVVTVNSGTSSTPVRVQASTCTTPTNPCTGSTLTTQSDKLTITTGIPDQQNFSLSATTLNIEGWNQDGITTVVTARLADHFNNPVPDGTSVVFTTEGGSITSTCDTVGGGCSATLTSQALRPTNGRVTVLAYAVGEEGFSDANGNGLADQPTEMLDANGLSTDEGEAFVDWNENGTRQANEPYIDFNSNSAYDGPDGKYNGVLCDPNVAPGSSAVACNTLKATHVRDSLAIVFSGSDSVTTAIPAAFDLGGCGNSQTANIDVRDLHGNVMPAGTKVDVTTSNGKLVAPFGFVVGNTNNFPALNEYSVIVLSDGTLSGNPAVCTDPTVAGRLTITVTTPLGVITKNYIDVTN